MPKELKKSIFQLKRKLVRIRAIRTGLRSSIIGSLVKPSSRFFRFFGYKHSQQFFRRPFTLLEVMIAIFLIAIASSAMGIRMHRLVEEKKFHASADRLYAELESCRRLALNMQADWIVNLEKKPHRISLTRVCPETGKSIIVSWEVLDPLLWNGKPVQHLSIQFSATGQVAPSGLLEMVHSNQHIRWQLPQMFHIIESSDGHLPPLNR